MEWKFSSSTSLFQISAVFILNLVGSWDETKAQRWEECGENNLKKCENNKTWLNSWLDDQFINSFREKAKKIIFSLNFLWKLCAKRITSEAILSVNFDTLEWKIQFATPQKSFHLLMAERGRWKKNILAKYSLIGSPQQLNAIKLKMDYKFCNVWRHIVET
jgi:hypothetical protein